MIRNLEVLVTPNASKLKKCIKTTDRRNQLLLKREILWRRDCVIRVKMELKSSEYKAADKYNYTLKLRLKFLWRYLKVNFVIILMLIPEAIRGILNLIFPSKPKCIKDQVALVTGAGNGLGRAIAFRLARERCKLAIVDIDFYAAQQTAKEIETKFNITALPFKVDVSKYQEIAKLRQEIESSLGNVDILVNNAGLLSMNISLREGTPESIQKVIDVNLASHFWVSFSFF